MGVVATLAIVLGGLFVDHLSWGWIFFINLPIGPFALISIAARLHLPVKRTERSADLAGRREGRAGGLADSLSPPGRPGYRRRVSRPGR